jgi:AraC-like DNA-binding protein
MPAPDLANLARVNQQLPRLLASRDTWQLAGVRLLLQRYYYCIAPTAGYAIGSHVHDWFELSQLVAGRVEYADTAKAHTLGPGELFFMAPGYEHRWNVVEAPVVISSFQLKLTPLGDEGRRLVGALDDLSHRHTFRFRRNRELTRLGDTWADALAQRAAGGLLADKFHAWLHLYFAHFLESTVAGALPSTPHSAAAEADGFSRTSSLHIAEFIQQNIHQPIQLEDIASHFHYSVRHINRLFQGEHGVPLGQFILERKLQAAQGLLAATEHSVKHIAYSLGYTDVGYFCRLFRQHLMSTPTQYRDKLRESPARRR